MTDSNIPQAVATLLDGVERIQHKKPNHFPHEIDGREDSLHVVSMLLREIDMTPGEAGRRMVRAAREVSLNTPFAPIRRSQVPPAGVRQMIDALIDYSMVPRYTLDIRFPAEHWNFAVAFLRVIGMSPEEAYRRTIRRARKASKSVSPTV